MPKSSTLSLASISKLLDQKLDQKLKTQRKEIIDAITKYSDKTFATKGELKDEISRLEQKFSQLPTKEEYYSKMDEYIKETKAAREENAVLPQQVSDLRIRVTKIEDHLGLATS